MDGLIYFGIGMSVVGGTLLITFGILNTIAEDKKKKADAERVDSLEKRIATLEMLSDYGISEED